VSLREVTVWKTEPHSATDKILVLVAPAQELFIISPEHEKVRAPQGDATHAAPPETLETRDRPPSIAKQVHDFFGKSRLEPVVGIEIHEHITERETVNRILGVSHVKNGRLFGSEVSNHAAVEPRCELAPHPRPEAVPRSVVE